MRCETGFRGLNTHTAASQHDCGKRVACMACLESSTNPRSSKMTMWKPEPQMHLAQYCLHWSVPAAMQEGIFPSPPWGLAKDPLHGTQVYFHLATVPLQTYLRSETGPEGRAAPPWGTETLLVMWIALPCGKGKFYHPLGAGMCGEMGSIIHLIFSWKSEPPWAIHDKPAAAQTGCLDRRNKNGEQMPVPCPTITGSSFLPPNITVSDGKLLPSQRFSDLPTRSLAARCELSTRQGHKSSLTICGSSSFPPPIFFFLAGKGNLFPGWKKNPRMFTLWHRCSFQEFSVLPTMRSRFRAVPKWSRVKWKVFLMALHCPANTRLPWSPSLIGLVEACKIWL